MHIGSRHCHSQHAHTQTHTFSLFSIIYKYSLMRVLLIMNEKCQKDKKKRIQSNAHRLLSIFFNLFSRHRSQHKTNKKYQLINGKICTLYGRFLSFSCQMHFFWYTFTAVRHFVIELGQNYKLKKKARTKRIFHNLFRKKNCCFVCYNLIMIWA